MEVVVALNNGEVNMELKLKTLGELISIAHTLPNGILYLSGSYPWNIDTLGIVYSSEKGVTLEDVNPELIKQNHLTPINESSSLEDVVLNARLQKPDVSVLELSNHSKVGRKRDRLRGCQNE
jgi:hypothetical protein